MLALKSDEYGIYYHRPRFIQFHHSGPPNLFCHICMLLIRHATRLPSSNQISREQGLGTLVSLFVWIHDHASFVPSFHKSITKCSQVYLFDFCSLCWHSFSRSLPLHALYRVSTQRAQYKLWEEGKKRACTLTKDRVKRLNKLGFVSDLFICLMMLSSTFP